MNKLAAALFSALIFAASSDAAEKLFSPSYFPWKMEGWSSAYHVERVNLNTEALAPVAGTFLVPVDGIEYEVTFGAIDRSALVPFRAGRIRGSSGTSHVSVVGTAVGGRLWLPDFTPGNPSREIITRDGEVYLVDVDYDALAKRLVGDEVTTFMSEQARVTSSKHRAIRHPANPDPVCGANEVAFLQHNLVYGIDRSLLEWFGSADSFKAVAQATVNEYNLTVHNSGGGNFRFRLAEVQALDYTTSGSLLNDLTWSFSSAEVSALKARHGPNTFFGLWVNGRDPAGYGGLAAGGYTGGVSRGQPPHHVVGDISVLVGVHELGHNARKNHEKDDPGTGTPVIPNAYGYARDGSWRDAVSIGYNCPHGCPPAQFFANPEGRKDGVPTGTSETLNYITESVVFPATGAQKVCVVSQSSVTLMREVR